ncbi:WD40-repeat-containing domain protein [Aspergillus ambiguus]|uniref:putative ribosomal assembly complex component Ipi3 n=1 Tax=Aspergillus ambiguus TaxID=176160 RepID=UPI003CCE4B15
MLAESFIASTLPSVGKPPPSAALRDVGVCIHEFQPAPNLRSTFKKSSTAPNCLAVSPSHVFAAQSDKAIVHVYSREKGNQEATVPFPERIRSIAIAGRKNGDVLVLGTEDSTGGGRLILWETCTGRQVASTASHLKPVTSLVVDPTSNFILSGSSDGSILVWSLVDLLSFTKPPSGRDRQPANGPLHTFSHHRAAISALAVGHSSGRYNIAVSTAHDSTAVAWDYRSGRVLRTFLLPASAISVALDPVDRAFYVGYDDGSVQAVDFYHNAPTQHPLHDPSLQQTPAQVPPETRWTPPSADCGAANALTLSHDGMTLLSGHHAGKILAWNVGRRKYAATVADFTHPVTNLRMLPLDGLPRTATPQRATHTIVKPRYDSALSERSATDKVPVDYTFSTHLLASSLPSPRRRYRPDAFTTAFSHAFFPESLLEEGLAELSALDAGGGGGGSSGRATTASVAVNDVDAAAKDAQIAALETELATLKQKASASDAARRSSTDEITRLRADLVHLHDYLNELQAKQEETQRERVDRRARREARDTRRREAWFAAEKKGKKGDVVMRQMEVEEGALTSDTDELSSGE